MSKKVTAEFLEELWRVAKKNLPGWAYSALLTQARATAGGRRRAASILERAAAEAATTKSLDTFGEMAELVREELDERLLLLTKATWSRAKINRLPDSAFLYIETGGEKDDDGRTVPRSLRHFPFKDDDGKVDLPHLRNALARLPQSKIPGMTPEKLDKIRTKAEMILDEMKVEKNELAVEVLVTKADRAKQIVYGAVADPYGSNGAQEDGHEDWFSPAAVEEMSHDYMLGKRIVGLEHQKKVSATVVESWVEPYPTQADYKAAMKNLPHTVSRRPFGDDVIHSGSWWMGVKLGNEEWNAYLEKEINAFSPGGIGIREPLTRKMMPSIKFVDMIPKGA